MEWLNAFIEFGWGDSVLLYNPQYSWVGIAAVAIAAVGAVSNFVGSKKAEDAAKDQAAEREQIEKKLTAAKIEQLDIDERVQYGETLAGYAGGGVLAQTPGMDPAKFQTGQYGSPLVVMQEAARAFARTAARRSAGRRIAKSA